MTNQHVPIPLPLTRHVHVMLHPQLMGETTVIHTTRAVSTSMCKPTTQAKEARGVPRAPRPAPCAPPTNPLWEAREWFQPILGEKKRGMLE